MQIMPVPADNNRKFCWLAALLKRDKAAPAGKPSFAAHAQSVLDAPDTTVYKKGSLTRENVSLADLQVGECGFITRLLGSTQGRLRLLEMGLTPGTHVKVIHAAAFGGPLDVQVRGYQLSLRRDEAASVWLGGEDEAEK